MLLAVFAAAVLFAGCGGSDTPAPTPTSTPQPSPPPEKVVETPEQAAKREAAEEAEAQRRYNQALEHTLKITPEEFEQNFTNSEYNYFSEEISDLSRLRRIANTSNLNLRYNFDKDVALNAEIDPVTGKIREIVSIAYKGSNSAELRDNLALAVLVYAIAISAASPELSEHEIVVIMKDLGMDNINNYADDSSVTYGGRQYARRMIRGLGLEFSISAK